MTQTLSRRDVDAAREAMAQELEVWSMYPLLESMPQYLAPIAKDAGVDLRALKSMDRTLRAMDRKGRGGGAAADALAGRMAAQIRRLIGQVDNASLAQVASYGGLDGTIGAQRSGDARRVDSPGGALYRAFVKDMIARCGLGFHPDTPVDKYVDANDRPSFSKAETKLLQRIESRAYAMGGFDQYEIAMQEMRPLIRAAKKRTGR